MEKIKILFQIILGTIVTSALLALWIRDYLNPLLTVKNELALAKAELIQVKAEYQEQINLEKTEELNKTIKEIGIQLNNTQKLMNTYKKQLSDTRKILENEKKDQSINQEKASSIDLLLNNIIEKQKKIEIDEKEVQQIITFNALNGLWKDTGKIDNKNVYIEFLPKGSIRTYAGLDGEKYIFSNQKWYLENNQIIIESNQDGEALKTIGKLVNNSLIKGEQEISKNNKIPWKLERAR